MAFKKKVQVEIMSMIFWVLVILFQAGTISCLDLKGTIPKTINQGEETILKFKDELPEDQESVQMAVLSMGIAGAGQNGEDSFRQIPGTGLEGTDITRDLATAAAAAGVILGLAVIIRIVCICQEQKRRQQKLLKHTLRSIKRMEKNCQFCREVYNKKETGRVPGITHTSFRLSES